MSHDLLIRQIQKHVPLSDADIDVLKSLSRIKKVRKRQFVSEQGEICRYENFVAEGCLRCYHIDPKGVEHVVQFAVEGWWVSDLRSFKTESPADFSVEAIEASTLIQFRLRDLEELYRRIPALERFFRTMFEYALIAAQKRIVDSYSEDAKQRYLEFRQRHPDIEKRVPNYMIASFLGITPEFLSRIRQDN
jgi:CRP-like cAMP-binding protein